MNNWTEFHISIIYYTGLLVALITGILTVLYLRPIRATIRKITEKFDTFWIISFKTTVILAGLLGALSVSFEDCEGHYDKLLKSPNEVVMKGVE